MTTRVGWVCVMLLLAAGCGASRDGGRGGTGPGIVGDGGAQADSHVSGGGLAFGESCDENADCLSDHCYVGEQSGEVGPVPFCSEDCTGDLLGATCGGGIGKCLVGAGPAECFVPCITNADCTAVNPDRGYCEPFATSNGAGDFSICVVSPSSTP